MLLLVILRNSWKLFVKRHSRLAEIIVQLWTSYFWIVEGHLNSGRNLLLLFYQRNRNLLSLIEHYALLHVIILDPRIISLLQLSSLCTWSDCWWVNFNYIHEIDRIVTLALLGVETLISIEYGGFHYLLTNWRLLLYHLFFKYLLDEMLYCLILLYCSFLNPFEFWGRILLDYLRFRSLTATTWHDDLVVCTLHLFFVFWRLLFIQDHVEDGVLIGIRRKTLYLGIRGLVNVGLVVVAVEHPLVMLENLWRKTFQDPLMIERFKRGHSIHRVPIETCFKEVQEILVRALQYTLEGLGKRLPLLSTRISNDDGLVFGIKEQLSPTRALK